MIRRATILFALWPFACPALTLEFPQNARLVDQTTTTDPSYDMPIGPWTEAGIPTAAYRRVADLDAAKAAIAAIGALPFTALLVVFFAVVAVIHEEEHSRPHLI